MVQSSGSTAEYEGLTQIHFMGKHKVKVLNLFICFYPCFKLNTWRQNPEMTATFKWTFSPSLEIQSSTPSQAEKWVSWGKAEDDFWRYTTQKHASSRGRAPNSPGCTVQRGHAGSICESVCTRSVRLPSCLKIKVLKMKFTEKDEREQFLYLGMNVTFYHIYIFKVRY